MMTNLQGMFVYNDAGDGRYRTGTIEAETPGGFLIAFDRFDGGNDPLPMEIVSHEQISACCDECGSPKWMFFRTRRDLDAWLAPMIAEQPKDTVVRLVKH